MDPIPAVDAQGLLDRMPARARADLAEWSSAGALADLRAVLSREVPFSRLIPSRPSVVITTETTGVMMPKAAKASLSQTTW
jgi:hypothetical protein